MNAPEDYDPPETRVRGFMQTYTGREYYFAELSANDIEILDIAHSLSNVCRFNGHCSHFYSVAQHSALVAYILAYEMDKPEHALWGLLHDASEAYIGDMLWGLKHDTYSDIGKLFRELEHQIEMAIAEKFKLPWPKPPEVKYADRLALAGESKILMGGAVEKICCEIGVPKFSNEFGKGIPHFTSMIPAEAKILFMDWYKAAIRDALPSECTIVLRPW